MELGKLLRDIYSEARYDLRVDYNRPPTPRLASADAEWAAGVLDRRSMGGSESG